LTRRKPLHLARGEQRLDDPLGAALESHEAVNRIAKQHGRGR
jgi:hypothetical protein